MNNTRLPTWLSNYFREHPDRGLWQFILGVGGIILTIHFAYIGFFPDLDWQSSLALLAIIALSGLFIWTFICLAMVFPSQTWAMFLDGINKQTDAAAIPTPTSEETSAKQAEKSRKVPKKLLFASVRGRLRLPEKVRKTLKNFEDEVSILKLGILFGVPPFVPVLAIGVMIWLGRGESFITSPLGVASLILLIFPASVAVYQLKSCIRALGKGFQSIGFWRYSGAVLLGGIVFVIPVMLTNAFVYSRYNPSPWKMTIFIFGVGLCFLYNLMAFRRWLDNSLRETEGAGLLKAFFIGVALLVSVLGMTENWVLIPEGLASLYGIGNVKGVTLTLDREGCAAADELGLGAAKKEGGELCRLENVTVLNRLGATYYVETPEGTRFTLPSSSVKSLESPAPALLEIKIEPVADANGRRTVKLTLTNHSETEIDEVDAHVEVRDAEGRLLWQTKIVIKFVNLPAGQSQKQSFDFPLPSNPAQINYYVFLSRYGKELPYVRMMETVKPIGYEWTAL